MKHTLQSRFLPSIAQHLVDGTLPPHTYPQPLTFLHTAAVRQASFPLISAHERTLSRSARTSLSQLRSAHCASLCSYQARIGATDSPA